MRALAMLMLTVAAAGALPAQGVPGCDSAAARVVGIPLPAAGTGDWAFWSQIATCGAQGAAAIATHVASPPFGAETNKQRLELLFSIIGGVRDGQLVPAYSSAMRAATSTVRARLFAANALGNIALPRIAFNEADFRRPSPAVCRVAIGGGAYRVLGDSASLPYNYASIIAADFASLEADAQAPPQVRGAAHCWWALIANRLPVDPHLLSLEYVCGNRFSIRNRGAASAEVTYTTGKDTSTHRLLVAPLVNSTPFSVGSDGIVRVYYASQLVDSKANGHVPCP